MEWAKNTYWGKNNQVTNIYKEYIAVFFIRNKTNTLPCSIRKMFQLYNHNREMNIFGSEYFISS